MRWIALAILGVGVGIMAMLQIYLSEIRDELRFLVEAMHEVGLGKTL